jgi:hypothetical protein
VAIVIALTGIAVHLVGGSRVEVALRSPLGFVLERGCPTGTTVSRVSLDTTEGGLVVGVLASHDLDVGLSVLPR